MESALENGCLSSPLRHTPQSKGEEEEKSATSTESAQTSWQSMISINDPATQVVRDKIPKNNLIAAIHQQGSTGPEASLCGGGGGGRLTSCQTLYWSHGGPDLDFSWLRVKVCPDAIVRS